MSTKVRVYKGRSNRGCILLVIVGILVACVLPFCALGGLIYAATQGLFGEAEIFSAQYEEPRGDADSADIRIVAGVSEMQVGALNDSPNLFEADIRYVGGINYDVSGESSKRIRLEQTQGDLDFLGVLSTLNININPTEQPLTWAINLTRSLPLALDVEGGVGRFTLDLSQIRLTDLRLETGVGDSQVTLPQPEESYNVNINGGTGSMDLTLPEGVEVRLEIEQGVGNVTLPDGLERISGSDRNSTVGENGVWETPGYDDADVRLTIRYDGGVGDFTVRRG